MAEKKWYEKLDDAVDVDTTEPERTRSVGDFAIDTGRSFAQGLTFAQADELEALARALYGKFAEGQDFNTAYDEILKSVRKDIKEFREDEPFVAYPAEIAGNIPSAIGAGARLANLGVKGLKNIATQGGLYGFGASEGDPVERLPDTAVSTAISTGLGKALPPVTEKAKELIKQGVPLTLGQSVGGGIRKLEEGIKSIPFLGDPIVGAEIRATQGFNKATFRKVLEPLEKYGVNLKKQLKGKTTGNELYKTAEDIISNGYEKLKPKLQFPNRDELQSIYDDVILKQADTMPKSVNNQFLQDMDNIVYKNFSPDGSLSGDDFKKIQSGLREQIRGYISSGDQVTRNYANSYNKVLEALTDTLVKNNPKYAPQLNDLDFSFKMLNIVGKAVEKGGTKQGTFTPNQLMQASRMADVGKNKKSFRKGEALMQDLANEGQALNLTLPDSGTATRQLLTGGLLNLGGAGAGIDPLMTGLTTGGLISGYSRFGVPTVRDYIYGMGVPSARNVTSGLLSSNVTPEMNIGR
tara:strand:- start:244 stop:1809 length:1566 start_codon:yes stop_codon:yes gene_type:complete